ncbi:hypothetical protein HDV04_004171 [Boothiomyces sp. JEL0838]|nr:hypothetical protein HDV04_004171 [Boothiomyces sp. JEL0838]
MGQIRIVNHPIFLEKLSCVRDEKLKSREFRALVSELTLILGITATERLDVVTTKQLHTPIGPYTGIKLKDEIGVFPIMRAGQGMIDSFLTLLPGATVHHLGLFRDKTTLLPVEYYNKLPSECKLDVGFIVDPMIATAGTAVAAVNILKDWGLKRIVFCSILVSKSGVEALQQAHPDIDIVVGHIDEELTDKGYIYPGLGDAGDRLFNTSH